MNGWKGIVGASFDCDGFEDYCHKLHWTSWRPSFVVLHNTAVPSLAQRPNGLSIENIRALESYYRDDRGWSSGPHLFIDDRQIWVFTPLTVSGTHSPSWNKLAIGIEMLGDYNKESFEDGRGLRVRDNTMAAMATVSAVLGLDPDSMRLHYEDQLTSHHGCPGRGVVKERVISGVQRLVLDRHQGDHQIVA